MTTVLGAIVQAVVARDVSDVPQGPLGGRVYRSGKVPTSPVPTYPYGVVTWPVGETPSLEGDGRTLARVSDGQIDVWEQLADEKGAGSDTWEAVRDLLDNVRVSADRHVLRVRVMDAVRTADRDSGLLRHMLLLRIHRVT